MMNDVSYRWVDGITASDADWDRIEAILAARGWMSLNRPTTRILLAEDAEGKLAGFSILQMVPHLEPLWVAPSQRASGLAESLADQMVDFMVSIQARGWMVVAESPFAARLCEREGMVKVEVPVYVAK